MHPFELTILGCSSATPTSSRNPTSQVLNHRDRYFLLDCGEGTQMQLRRFKIKMQRIDHIFISHLHGDHYLGLPGLLGTLHLLGRDKDLHVYAPPGLEEIIKVSHHHSRTFLRFGLIFHTIAEGSRNILFDDEKLSVESIPMDHRIPCYGFLFREKPGLRNIRVEKLAEYRIPVEYLSGLKQGKDWTTTDGRVIPNSEITSDPPAPRTYVFCSDTIYSESYLEQIKGADLLYHEATFAEDMKARTKETYHCTAREAATIAQKSGVKKLIIGHFSARYHDLEPLLREAKELFANTVLAAEGENYTV